MEFINKTSYTREEDLKRLKFIPAILSLNTRAKVLDVGCENGNNSSSGARKRTLSPTTF
jgi:cyclopropane fatty-acyl-phospholipid synthase-like methyltransferase